MGRVHGRSGLLKFRRVDEQGLELSRLCVQPVTRLEPMVFLDWREGFAKCCDYFIFCKEFLTAQEDLSVIIAKKSCVLS